MDVKQKAREAFDCVAGRQAYLPPLQRRPARSGHTAKQCANTCQCRAACSTARCRSTWHCTWPSVACERAQPETRTRTLPLHVPLPPSSLQAAFRPVVWMSWQTQQQHGPNIYSMQRPCGSAAPGSRTIAPMAADARQTEADELAQQRAARAGAGLGGLGAQQSDEDDGDEEQVGVHGWGLRGVGQASMIQDGPRRRAQNMQTRAGMIFSLSCAWGAHGRRSGRV